MKGNRQGSLSRSITRRSDRREPVSFAVNRQKTNFAKRNVYFDKTDGYGGKVAAKCGEWREKC